MFQTYDGVKLANDSMKVVFDAHGAKFTVYLAQIHADNTDTIANGDRQRMSYTDLATFSDAGYEIGTHSRNHNGPSNGFSTANTWNGVAFWEQGADSIGVAWRDSLSHDMDAVWITAGVLIETGRDLSTRSNFAKSFGSPSGQHGPNILLESFGSIDLGYSGLGHTAHRSQLAIAPTLSGYYDFFDAANWRAADSDSTFGGFHVLNDPNVLGQVNQRAPLNVRGLAMTFEIDDVVGDATTFPVKADIQKVFRRVLYQHMGNHRGVMSTDIHDVKTNYLNNDYDDRADPAEMDWILEVLDDYNIWYGTDTQYTAWMAANGTAMDTPAAFAQPDSFKYTAADKIWYLPDGVDGRFIPGVK